MADVNPVPQVRTYTMNHPPLAALAMEANDYPAVGIHVGDEMLEEHLQAADQQYRARIFLQGSGLATFAEVIAAEKRKSGIVNESVTPLPVGQDWAQELTREIRQMNEQMQQMHRQLNERMNEQTRLMNVSSRVLVQLSVQTARNTNRMLQRHETIAPVPNAVGVAPEQTQNATKALVLAFPLPVVVELLRFYELDEALDRPDHQKRAALLSHLGFNKIEVDDMLNNM